jgi:hypothetical protein
MPSYGLILLPGMKHLGLLYGSLRNCVEELVLAHRPTRLLFCMALFRDRQSAARALNGVQAVAELVAYDNDIEALEANESRARKVVLGRGTFGGKDENGRLIPGLGSKQAKAAVMKWCAEQGFEPATHDVGDALVLLRYAQHMDATGKAMRRWDF